MSTPLDASNLPSHVPGRYPSAYHHRVGADDDITNVDRDRREHLSVLGDAALHHASRLIRMRVGEVMDHTIGGQQLVELIGLALAPYQVDESLDDGLVGVCSHTMLQLWTRKRTDVAYAADAGSKHRTKWFGSGDCRDTARD